MILPPLRSPKKLADLRKAWEKRILHEGEILQWGRETGARGELSADMERFLTERRPQMQWDMEMDLFAAGDQKGAALRMLEHIEKHPSHENCPDWISAFQVAIKGEITPPVSGGNEAAGESGE